MGMYAQFFFGRIYLRIQNTWQYIPTKVIRCCKFLIMLTLLRHRHVPKGTQVLQSRLRLYHAAHATTSMDFLGAFKRWQQRITQVTYLYAWLKVWLNQNWFVSLYAPRYGAEGVNITPQHIFAIAQKRWHMSKRNFHLTRHQFDVSHHNSRDIR